MKFVYQYRTADNVLKRGEIAAPDREAAFQSLKAQGIRPARLDEAPGFFNKLFGKGKRWIAIAVLTLIAAILAMQVQTRKPTSPQHSSPRHQIYGDPGFMAELEREDYASVFPEVGDRYLAHFAQPGAIVKFSSAKWRNEMAKSLPNVLEAPLTVSASDSREIRELKQIVLGMRDELRNYLSKGYGTYESFVKRMEERQTREVQIYLQAKNELANETDPAVFERRNASLRLIGLRTIPVPEGD